MFNDSILPDLEYSWCRESWFLEFFEKLVHSNKVDLVAISEPKVGLNKAPALGRYLNLGGFANCSSPDPKIWVF